MERTLNFILTSFLVAALCCWVGAVYWASGIQRFLDRALTARGEVIAIEAVRDEDSLSYRSVFKFTAASGETVVAPSTITSSPARHVRGERIDVAYLESNPLDARERTFFELWAGPLFVSGFGFVFSLIGGVPLLWRRVSRAREQALRSHGTPIQAEFQSVERNTTLIVNGESPWRIVTRWQDPESRRLYLFRSKNLWFDPTSYVSQRHITVYIDRRDPRRYHVDISFLPELVD